MRIKELIDTLQKLYDAEMVHYEVMGEPEIVLDVFSPCEDDDHRFEYAGFTNSNFVIDRSADGVYLIISAFAESYPHEKPPVSQLAVPEVR